MAGMAGPRKEMNGVAGTGVAGVACQGGAGPGDEWQAWRCWARNFGARHGNDCRGLAGVDSCGLLWKGAAVQVWRATECFGIARYGNAGLED